MGLPRYILNFDELTEDLKKNLLELISLELKDKCPELNTNNVEALLEDIKKLMPSVKYEELKKKIEDLFPIKYNAIQKVEGKLLDIPPLVQKNKEIFKFKKDIFITGLHINQTGWKKEDEYSLEINKNKIIDCAATKEIGEHKHFNTYFKVNADTPISFILDNKSGNSRQVMVDLEYLAGRVIKVLPKGNVLFLFDTTGSMETIYSAGENFFNNLSIYLSRIAKNNLIYTTFFGDVEDGETYNYTYINAPTMVGNEFINFIEKEQNVIPIGGVNAPEYALKVLELYKLNYKDKDIKSIFIATDADKIIPEVSKIINEIDIPIFVYIPTYIDEIVDNVWANLEKQNKIQIVDTF